MYKFIIHKLFKKANIEVGRDIIIHDNSFYKDVVLKGSLGFGESYMQKKWDSPDLHKLIIKILEKEFDKKSILGIGTDLVLFVKSTFQNLQSKKYTPDLYETHYNAGNFLFESFLDPNMIYTCGYFQNTNELKQAQLDKIKIIGEKLKLKKGDKVLDIGCGWGGTARILSQMFDVEVIGVADTPNQIAYAKKHNASKKVKFIKSDYRDIKGQFDKIYNVGFLEAVGPKNYRSFMKLVGKLLTPDGIFVTHTIGGEESVNSTESWIDKYIFPHGVIPSRKQMRAATKNIFKLRDFEAFGTYYDTTLHKWNERFNKNWNTIKDKFKDPNSFKRMMNYYLLSCASSFAVGKNDVWHFVYTKINNLSEYKPYRLPKA